MAFICYKTKKFGREALAMISKANEIIDDYKSQGFQLTLRQLYYQFVSKDLIPNTMKSYKNLGNVINEGRLAGRVDWTAIIDRTRELRSRQHWESTGELVGAAANSFNVNQWKGQPTQPEVWIEKDALIGVIEDVCRNMDVPYFSCRGYTSQSEMWEAGQRIEKRYLDDGQYTCILHFGDHDPSGKDMSRDISERIQMFLNGEGGEDSPGDAYDAMTFKRMALHIEQVKHLKLPPNPAKLTDTRAKGYISEFGTSSWELDAMEPKLIVGLIANELKKFVTNKKAWDTQEQRERDGRLEIKEISKKMGN